MPASFSTTTYLRQMFLLNSLLVGRIFVIDLYSFLEFSCLLFRLLNVSSVVSLAKFWFSRSIWKKRGKFIPNMNGIMQLKLFTVSVDRTIMQEIYARIYYSQFTFCNDDNRRIKLDVLLHWLSQMTAWPDPLKKISIEFDSTLELTHWFS